MGDETAAYQFCVDVAAAAALADRERGTQVVAILAERLPEILRDARGRIPAERIKPANNRSGGTPAPTLGKDETWTSGVEASSPSAPSAEEEAQAAEPRPSKARAAIRSMLADSTPKPPE